ncbi:12S rRNA N4-methylcytidine methyltransferase-like [Artemia franciscana]
MRMINLLLPLVKSSQQTLYAKLSHVPVLAEETIEIMNVRSASIVMDMTFGGGGHSRKILETSNSVKVIAVDRDPVAYLKAKELAKEFPGRVQPILGKYSELRDLLHKEVQPGNVDCILFDCGSSSMQYDDPDRGFSISKDGPLDMRMDGDRIPGQLTAADVLANGEESDLAKIFKIYGEEKYAKKIARNIIESRYLLQRLRTTKEFASLVANSIGYDTRSDKLDRPTHSATKCFQALRIFVNNELNELDFGLHLAYKYLRRGGRVVALTFHSLEDRIVKRHFLGIDMDEPINQGIGQKMKNAQKVYSKDELESYYEKKWSVLFKEIITPSDEEVRINPRSRSVKLRCALKIE